MNITEDMLRNAAAEVQEAMLDSLSKQEDMDHVFSRRFERKMNRLIQKQKGGHQTLQRIAAVFLALLLGGGIWLTVDADASAAFRKWVQSVYENSIVYRFFNGNGELPPLGQYQPAWIPEGYTESNLLASDSHMFVVFSNAAGEKIYFRYMELDRQSQIENLLDGMADPTNLTVNSMQGIFYQSTDPARFNELLWFDTDQGVAFQLSSSLPETVMLHMAEGVSLVDSTK